MVAAEEKQEQAGGESYHNHHMGTIFKKGFSFSGFERDMLKLSMGDGSYLDISGISGVDSISDGRGAVFADFDNDGDSDIFLVSAQRKAHYLFRNNVGSDRHFLRVELEGRSGGRDAFGAIVRVHTAHGIQTKVKAGGSGFLSQHDPRLLFGLGDETEVARLEVAWPGGESLTLTDLPIDTTIRLTEGQNGFQRVAPPSGTLPDPLGDREEMLARLGIRPGATFPRLELRDLGGQPRSLEATLRPGRKMLLNVWATWCTPCAVEIPELVHLYPELTAAGIDLVGLSVDVDPAADVQGYVARQGMEYPVLMTDSDSLDILYPNGEATVPLTLLLSDQGQVLEIYSGWSKRSAAALEALVKSGS
ncbi:hypothetical protein ABI59_23455 [Acidobacteria bacterium Mor1]|nr:hypothetical protein ABI59_23455 [Acidobacteria bacterium Mor1]